MNKFCLLSFQLLVFSIGWSQSAGYWQQKVDYKMNVVVDAKNYQYKGNQTLVYTNNSPDTLKRVYYHLYNNAFQPGSEMDARVQSIADPDRRMINKTKVDGKDVKESRIAKLKPNEIGYLRISNFKQENQCHILSYNSHSFTRTQIEKNSLVLVLFFSNGEIPIYHL